VALCLAAALAAAIALGGSLSLAAPPDSAAQLQAAQVHLYHGRYFAALRLLQDDRFDRASNEDAGTARRFRLQSLSAVLGALGQYRRAQGTYNESFDPLGPGTIPQLSPTQIQFVERTRVRPAEELILQAVKNHQIVILNETHCQPEHRAFGMRLVPKLAALGVTHFGLEYGDQEALDRARRSGRVMPELDYYGFEPQRANLLRAVLTSGMKPVAFDVSSLKTEWFKTDSELRERGLARDEAMARNIRDRILRDNPKAKVFIWVGMGHAYKVPIGGESYMAKRLWQRTGIEPFTIDQLSDSGDQAHTSWMYQWLLKAARTAWREPRAVELPLGSFDGAPTRELQDHPIFSRMLRRGVDAIVLHPPDAFEQDGRRPRWHLPENGATIQGSVSEHNHPCVGWLVQAKPLSEGPAAAPADQVLTGQAGGYVLEVQPGRYEVTVLRPTNVAEQEPSVARKRELRCRAGESLRWDVK
jgi:hypothetical protein